MIIRHMTADEFAAAGVYPPAVFFPLKVA